MTLERGDFSAFFALVNDGATPYAWQERLLDFVLDHGRWPDVIGAPTGAGKSNVVDVHVFANALSALGVGPRVPRRLFAVVDRRALVDNQADRARKIRAALAGASPIADQIRLALTSLGSGATEEFLVLAEMRGGLAPEAGWLDDPGVCAVVNATPDMVGSRMLFRGYGSSRAARPREAGLIGYDTVLVLDEGHLNQQLLLTARRVSGWAEARSDALGVPALQVCVTTATPASTEGAWVGVSADDVDAEPTLRARLSTARPFIVVPSPVFPTKSVDVRHIDLLSQLAQDAAGRNTDTVGCIVNRVETATLLAARLTKAGLRVLTWVGRMRPMDIQRIRQQIQELDAVAGARSVDVIVATQTVEVGVDLDLAELVTELAPASALAQRAGRVNRRGLRSSGPIAVVVPEGLSADEAYPPYQGSDLLEAVAWLGRLADEGRTLSAWDVACCPPPPTAPRRLMLKRPELHDVQRWAVTSMAMFAEESLELWLRDSLDPDDQVVSVVLRGPLPQDDAAAIALLQSTPPTASEAFPVMIGTARNVLKRVLSGQAGSPARAFYVRDEQAVAIDGDDSPELRPGDVLIVPTDAEITRSGVVVDAPATGERAAAVWGNALSVILPGTYHDDLLSDLVGMDPEEAQSVATSVLGYNVQVILPPDQLVEHALPWLVITSPLEPNENEESRQAWSSGGRVSLGSHRAAVRDRAERLTRALGLASAVASLVHDAAERHDDGKDDPRFQARLGGGSELMAKSHFRNEQQARRAARHCGLEPGWRHEHRSACHAWAELAGQEHADLVVRLVGASHGHGRGMALASSEWMTSDADPAALREAAVQLFDEGEWHDIVGRTELAWGAWGCAYLEAVVRSADCLVSREGS